MRKNMAKTQELLFVRIKQDYKRILLWIIGLNIFSAGFIPAFVEITKGEGLAGMYEIMKNPAIVSIVGPTPAKDLTEYTLGALYSHEMLLFCGLFSFIPSSLYVIRHTRKEESLGILEMIDSRPVGKLANSTTVIFSVFLINIIISFLISGMMIYFKEDTITTKGALLFGFSIGMAGLLGAAIGLLMSQLMSTSSEAIGSSMGILGLLYMLRGMTDIINLDLSYFNPLSWTYLTFPFTKNNPWPIFYGLLFFIIIVGVSFALENRRDLGASLFKEKEGRKTARKLTTMIPSLIYNLNKGMIFSWITGLILLGIAYDAI